MQAMRNPTAAPPAGATAAEVARAAAEAARLKPRDYYS